MSPQQTARALREIADRLDDSALLNSTDLDVEIRAFNVNDLGTLKAFSQLMDEAPVADSSKGYHWIIGSRAGVKLIAHYRDGLLEKTRVRKVVELSTETNPDVSVLVSR